MKRPQRSNVLGTGGRLRVLQRQAGEPRVGRRVLLGQRRLEDGVPGQKRGGAAERRPQEVQHAGREQDEDPGVDDGVDRDEDEGDQVQPVGLTVPLHAVDVHSDLGRGGGEEGSSRGGEKKR